MHFKEESGLSWAEMNRRLGTEPHTIRRWRDKGVRPSTRHIIALLNLADSLGLGHLFTELGSAPERGFCPGSGTSGQSGV